MYECIVWERTGDVVVITLDRPRVLNALNRALKELADALSAIKGDESVRAVVITGAGDQAFSAGQDLTEAKDMTGPEAEEWVREFELLYDQVRMLDVPVIAAVNGWAMGAGCQLALLADVRISSENARYGMPEIRDGIPAVFGLELLWNTIGMSRGLYLVLSGDSLDARQAQEAGLTIKVVARRDLLSEAMALAQTMARFAPIAMKQNKQYARRREADFRACARFCESAHHASFAAGDAKRGMEAFLTKSAETQRWRDHSFRRVSSSSTPSPGPSSARIAPSAYCTGRRTTSPSRSRAEQLAAPRHRRRRERHLQVGRGAERGLDHAARSRSSPPPRRFARWPSCPGCRRTSSA